MGRDIIEINSLNSLMPTCEGGELVAISVGLPLNGHLCHQFLGRMGRVRHWKGWLVSHDMGALLTVLRSMARQQCVD